MPNFEWDENKPPNHKITVTEALDLLDAGQSLATYTIDFAGTRVESLDVMKLLKAGKSVPEDLIYYQDEDILDDEEFAGPWQQIDTDPVDALPLKKR